MQVNAGRDQVHHHGPLSGVGAGAAAVLAVTLLCGVLAFAVWHQVAREVSVAVAVIVWALTAAVVGVLAAALVFVFLWVRHRALHPETFTRHAVRAEVLDHAPAVREIPPPVPVAELPPGPLWRLNPQATYDPAIPGTAGDATTEGK